MDFHTFVRSQPRPFPDPYIEWHLQQYDIVTDLKYDLEALTSKPLLTIEDLSDLAVVRDGEFNIDEDKPIDIGTVFFSIGSLKEVAECVASYQELKSWPELPPGDEHLLNHWDLPLSDIDHVQHYSHLCWRLVEWVNRYSINQGRFTHRENKNWIKPAVFQKTNFYHSNQDWITSTRRHDFSVDRWFAHHPSMVHGIPGPEVSHTVLMVSDTIKPDDRLLRSELLMAAMLIRDNLAQGFWRGHHTLPVLVISFHQTGCRVLQVHIENGKLHVRASRLMDLTGTDDSVPPDAWLVARWLMAKPIGSTHFYEIRDIPSPQPEAFSFHRPRRHPGASCVSGL